MNKVKHIPEGFHTLTPHIIVKGLPKALEFYKKALGATELSNCEGPDGKVCHAELKLGDSILMMCEECAEMGALSPLSAKTSGVTLHVYVKDVDAAFALALKAGAKQTMPVADMFWGDRYGKFVDPFGHSWALATHKEDVAPKEMRKRMEEQFAAAAK